MLSELTKENWIAIWAIIVPAVTAVIILLIKLLWPKKDNNGNSTYSGSGSGPNVGVGKIDGNVTITQIQTRKIKPKDVFNVPDTFNFPRTPLISPVVGVDTSVNQAGKGLVENVPRDIATADAPFVSLQITAEDVLPDLGADGTGVAIAMLLLGSGDFADNVIDSLLEPPIAGTGIHKGQGAHVVAGGLPDDVFEFPAFIPLALGRQTGSFVIRPEHPVGVKSQQVLLIDLHCSLELAREKFHLA